MSDLTIEAGPSKLDREVTRWALTGHLDAETVRRLETGFDAEVRKGRVRWLVDLSGLDYISSAGLGSFVGVLSELRSRGGDLFFTGLGPKFEKIFRMLGFLRVFRVFDDEAAAVAAFREGR